MSPQISYLNPRKFFASPRLDDVLLVVPSYVQPDVRTHACLDQAVRAGADICSSFGCSDPALHRCMIAGRAMHELETRPGRYAFICWIDDDMVFSPAHVAFLRKQSEVMGAAVTGIYCRRGDPKTLCIRMIPEQDEPIEPRRVQFDAEPPWKDKLEAVPPYTDADFWAYPVTAGMGCLVVPVDHFMKHCHASESVVATAPDGSKITTPGVCNSGMAQDRDGVFGWRGEDETYCEGLWVHGNGLWTAPIVFGHISSVPLQPAMDAVWMSDHEQTNQTIPAPTLDPVSEVASADGG